MSRLAREAVEKAKATGELPHEFLLRVSRGEIIGDHEPTFEERVAAAQAAAPYFAPKLAAIEQKIEAEVQSVISSDPMTVEDWDATYASSLGTAAGTAESVD